VSNNECHFTSITKVKEMNTGLGESTGGYLKVMLFPIVSASTALIAVSDGD